VRTLLDTYPFAHGESSVSVLDGAAEGAFQWLTLNYLLGNLEKGVPVRRSGGRRRRRGGRAAADADAIRAGHRGRH
jgi:Golgi nucleoside diphosphatase